MTTWREVQREVEGRLRTAGLDDAALDARRLVEEASGHAGADLVLHLDDEPLARSARYLFEMVGRRAAGEPLQYVIGHWPFRHLDLLVDRRVLIPRPETEEVVSHALATLPPSGPATVVDLGTGSGCIALSIASERPETDVWAVDASADALDVARANLAGLGRAGRRVRLLRSDWFSGLPGDLRHTVDLIVGNPPYVAETDPLPAEVADWEPVGALVPGPTGLEDVERILRAAPDWLGPLGAVVLEIGETQGEAATALAQAAGFGEVRVLPDLAGRPRALVARSLVLNPA